MPSHKCWIARCQILLTYSGKLLQKLTGCCSCNNKRGLGIVFSYFVRIYGAAYMIYAQVRHKGVCATAIGSVALVISTWSMLKSVHDLERGSWPIYDQSCSCQKVREYMTPSMSYWRSPWIEPTISPLRDSIRTHDSIKVINKYVLRTETHRLPHIAQ